MNPEKRQNQTLERIEKLVVSGAWPPSGILNARGWLRNFRKEEIPFALDILDSLIVVTNAHLTPLLAEAFNKLSTQISASSSNFRDALSEWISFKESILVTHVTKEKPNPSESGYAYDRLLRQKIGIPKNNIVTLENAVAELEKKPGTLFLIDDIVCSGEQCIKMCSRAITLSNGTSVSLSEVCTKQSGRYVQYNPLFATEYGLDRIRRKHSWLKIDPVHTLDDTYRCNMPSSKVWKDGREREASDFILEVSKRANIETPIWGFHDLALCFAFEYGPPDATLPIIMESNETWTHLIQRT